MHDQVKRRVIATFLETAKYALKGSSKKINYIADDLTKMVINVDGDFISEADYGIVVTTSGHTKKIREITEQMAQSYMQNGGRFSTVLDIFNSSSLADMRNKIEQSEDEATQIAQASEEQAMEIEQAKMAFEKEKLDREDNNQYQDRLLKKYEIDTKYVAEQGKLDFEGDNLEEQKLALEEKKASDDLLVKIKQLDQDMNKARMDDKTKRYIANKKPATTTAAKK